MLLGKTGTVVEPVRHRVVRWAVLSALTVFVASCSVPAPEVQSYRIQYEPPPSAAKPLDIVLRVAPFGVASVYDREAIVYRDGEYRMGSYMLHRWAANPAGMVADLLARDLAASGAYRAVQKSVLVASDFDLSADVEALEEVVGEPSQANIAVSAVLVRTSGPMNDRVALRKTYRASEPVTGGDAEALVAAMGRALGRISVELQSDVYAAVSSAVTHDPK